MPSKPGVHRPPHRSPRAVEERERRRQREVDAARGNAAERGYDAEWSKLRAAYLAAHPVCECGCGRKADMVDHILRVAVRPDLRLAWSNLQALATNPCHKRKTRERDRVGFGARSRP